MTEPRQAPTRPLTCEKCGAAFTCGGDVGCWCGDESFRLPMPAAGSQSDCLCPDCLRAAAAAHNAAAAGT